MPRQNDRRMSLGAFSSCNATLTRLDQSVRESDDYYPYGELVPSSGGTGDINKFTGKERDAESGLDDFVARHYASSLGGIRGQE